MFLIITSKDDIKPVTFNSNGKPVIAGALVRGFMGPSSQFTDMYCKLSNNFVDRRLKIVPDFYPKVVKLLNSCFFIIFIGPVKGCVRDAHCWPAQIRKFAGWRKSSAKNLECDRKKAWFNISDIIINYKSNKNIKILPDRNI